jgi:hypothetical protein
MKKIYQYKCTLLSDVILTSMANTQGYKESLNYISGAKWMGILAQKFYKENDIQKTLDLFHNGTVHFSDATPMIGDAQTLKVPYAWFYEKGENLSKPIYLHHYLNPNETEKQLKQARNGFFSAEMKTFAMLDQDFSIKSSYDANTRKSKDSEMYGYFSLKKGTTWSFCVEDDNGQYSEMIKAQFVGNHRIGKSKSAEYGWIEISFLGEKQEKNPEIYETELILYAQSNLCFYDDFGKCTAQPTVEQLVGTKNAKIVWEKSQIRARNYQTWNGKRNNRDADRLIIESGSVFFVTLGAPTSADFIQKGIGSHRNEGFGKVLVNPDFLTSKDGKLNFSLQKTHLKHLSSYAYMGGVEDDNLWLCLENRHKINDFESFIDKKVNEFVKDYKTIFQGVTKSQWGAVRDFAKFATRVEDFEKLIFSREIGFLYRGKSESVWRKNGRREKLEQYLEKYFKEEQLNGNGLVPTAEYFPFVVKLSNQMPKS